MLVEYIRKTVLILLLGICASGCAIFYYQQAANEPYATLKFMPINFSDDQYLEIQKVDNHRVHTRRSSSRDIRVLPGKHTLVFKEVHIKYEKVPEPGLAELAAVAAGFAGANVSYASAPKEPVPERSIRFVQMEVYAESGKTYVFDQYGMMNSTTQTK